MNGINKFISDISFVWKTIDVKNIKKLFFVIPSTLFNKFNKVVVFKNQDKQRQS